jgi:hypothetical protein
MKIDFHYCARLSTQHIGRFINKHELQHDQKYDCGTQQNPQAWEGQTNSQEYLVTSRGIAQAASCYDS